MIKIIILQSEYGDYDSFSRITFMEEMAEQLYAQMMGWC